MIFPYCFRKIYFIMNVSSFKPPLTSGSIKRISQRDGHMQLEKKKVKKNDGVYVIYYDFSDVEFSPKEEGRG